MKVCDNCMEFPDAKGIYIQNDMGEKAQVYDLCTKCRDLLLDRDTPGFAARHRSFPKPQPEPVEVVECSYPGCTYLGEGEMGQYQEDRCESHQVDDDGVLVVDCYCSSGSGDNMDVDICHHHMKVWS